MEQLAKAEAEQEKEDVARGQKAFWGLIDSQGMQPRLVTKH